ncbi:MAG: BatD family protein [Kiritimatiellae bacterium]|nr:BatD family protein [Kiritimatiellia bacterium]
MLRFSLTAALLLTAAQALATGDVSLNLRVDRPRIYLGESFMLQVEAGGARDFQQAPGLEALAPAETRFLGSQDTSRSSIRIVNGRVTRDAFLGRTFFFSVKPLSAGAYRAGPVTLKANGQTLRADGPTVEVVGVEQQDEVIVTVEASNGTVMVDEPFSVVLRVDVSTLPEPNAQIEPLHGQRPPHLQADFLDIVERPGLKQPDLAAALQALVSRDGNAPAFTINNYQARDTGIGNFFNMNFDNPFEPRPIPFRLPAKRVERNGRSYWEYSLALEYTPRQEGAYTFGPVTFKGPIITGGDEQGRPIWRELLTIGPAATVRVTPPPESGRPDWFIGSVGRNLRAHASFDTAVCKVGDPLTLTLDLTGEISLANLRPPVLSLQPDMPEHFRIYDENVESETIADGKRYRYRVRPLKSGTLEFPPIRIAYFDTQQKAYVTVHTDAMPLQAHATTQIAAALPTTEDAAGVGRQSLTARQTPIPDGIMLPPTGHARTPPGPRAPLRTALLALPPLLWTGLWLLRAAWRRRHAWAARWRRHGALSQALQALRLAGSAAAETPSAAATQAAIAVRQYLSLRLDAAGRALTANDLAGLLRAQPWPAAAATELLDVFGILEQLPYRAGEASPETVRDCIERARRALLAVDAAWRRQRRGQRAIVSLLAVTLLAGGAARADSISDDFLWERANQAMSAATNATGFLEAARLYHKLAIGSGGSGPVFFNLSSALLLAGDPVNAEAALVRAERYLGATPEVRTNWRLAIAARTRQPDAQLPPSRLLFAWHYGLSLNLRVWLALSGWLLFWAGLLLRMYTRPQRRRHGEPTSTRAFAGLLAWSGCLIALLYGVSVALTLLQERHDRRTWHERTLGPPGMAQGSVSG